MRVVRLMCGHNSRDKKRNEDIQDKVGVASIEDKMWKTRLKWFARAQRKSMNVSIWRCERLTMDYFNRGRGIMEKYREIIRYEWCDFNLSRISP